MTERIANKQLKLLDESPGYSYLTIKGCRLPTHKQALLCFLSHLKKLREEDKTKQKAVRRLASKAAIKELFLHYKKAGMPTITEKRACENLEKLHLNFQKLKKHYSAGSVSSFKLSHDFITSSRYV